MRKPSCAGSEGSPSPRSKSCSRKVEADQGRWEFSTISQRLIALGSTDRARRAAYRTATGELRFLPMSPGSTAR